MEHRPTLISVLTRAINHRTDIGKVSTANIPGRPELVSVKMTNRAGSEITREVGLQRLIDEDRTIGDIIDDWLGKEPPLKGQRSAAWHRDRAEAMAYTPLRAVQNALRHVRAGQTPQQPPAPANARAPGSSLDWDDGAEPVAAAPAVADPRPANPANADPSDSLTYKDPRTNERRPVLRRTEMVKLGMSREQRAQQYRIQGGPHPEDA